MNLDLLILFSKLLIAAEALAAIAGFITWRKWKGTYLRWFPVYLSLIVLLEMANRLMEHYEMNKGAGFFLQLSACIEMLFISWFFYQSLSIKTKKIAVIGMAVYITAFTAEKFLIQESGYFFQSLSYTIGNLFILMYLLLFFIELVNSERLLYFKNTTIFWIAFGMLVFYLGTFPFYGLYNELAKDLDLFVTLAWAATSLNYCMYLLFTIGFIWGKAH